MRRLLAAVAAVAVLVGCGGASGPKPFPGDAQAKVAEIVRRADLAGLQHENAAGLADSLGDKGGTSCAYKDEADFKRMQAYARGMGFAYADAPLERIIRDVYCPQFH